MESFRVEYSAAAENQLASLVEYLWQSKMNLPDDNIYSQELRAVRDSSDRIDRDLAMDPLAVGQSSVVTHELPDGYPAPDDTRVFALGALTVIYDVFRARRLVRVLQQSYSADRN